LGTVIALAEKLQGKPCSIEFEVAIQSNQNGGHMKKLFVAVLLMTLLGSYAYAAQDNAHQGTTKTRAQADAKSQAGVNADTGGVMLEAGSEVSAEMTSTLDLKNAKPGTPFKMKTSRPLKSDGKEIISRGSTITGHVEQITRADKTIQALLVFDQLQDKKTHLMSPLSATVTAVTRAENAASAMAREDMAGSAGGTSQQARSQPRSSQQSGGLLGGVTQTVTGATQTAAGATGQIGSTVGSTTNATLGANSGVAGAPGGLAHNTIQVVSNTTGNANSGSTLALSDHNPKIESGTQFVLQTTSSVVLSKRRDQQ
jgi:hypothetical protein